MALTQDERLRQLLGEEIPDGGSASETLFSDRQISDLLETNENLERAAYEGWRVKAAKLSSLVDTTEGNAQKKFSQLHSNALEQIKVYMRASEGPTEGRARVGRITRKPIPWS